MAEKHSKLSDVALKIRSKNAGPFWLTLDIFCGSDDAFSRVSKALSTEAVAKRLHADETTVKPFDIDALNVVKFSIPRPAVQGSHSDRDMHGAAWASVISELDIN